MRLIALIEVWIQITRFDDHIHIEVQSFEWMLGSVVLWYVERYHLRVGDDIHFTTVAQGDSPYHRIEQDYPTYFVLKEDEERVM